MIYFISGQEDKKRVELTALLDLDSLVVSVLVKHPKPVSQATHNLLKV